MGFVCAIGFGAVGCDSEVDKDRKRDDPKAKKEARTEVPTSITIEPEAAQGKDWGTIKGQVVWADKMPTPTKIMAVQDKQHCEANGPLVDQELVVNPKNQGVKWVFVWLAPKEGEATDAVKPVHPNYPDGKKLKPAEVDQPMCMFVPRSLAIQEGQNVLVKNSAPVQHSIKWTGNPAINPDGNVIIPPGKAQEIKNLQAQKLPLVLECSIHPWMRGRLAVFSHPYFAITDADGNFEIKDAPVGEFRIFVNQESVGWRNGAKGRNGEPITIKAGANDLGKLELKGN